MITDIIAGFLIALLSGMGVGSAGLLVVWLTAVDAMPQLAAQGLNLYFFLFSSSASLLYHVRHRNIFWSATAVMTAAGIVGAVGGTYLAALLDPALLRRLFGGMLTLTGVISLVRIFLSSGRAKKAVRE